MTSTPYCYDYPRPAVTVDIVLFRKVSDALQVLLIQRRNTPYQGDWALPGGFVDANEDPDQAALRELAEETGVTGQTLHPLGFWGHPDRDPRGHTISLAYWGLLSDPSLLVTAGDDASKAEWLNIKELPTLAFDHLEILQKGASKIQ